MTQLDKPPMAYRFGVDEQRIKELLDEHSPDMRVDELIQERFGSLSDMLNEQIKRRPR